MVYTDLWENLSPTAYDNVDNYVLDGYQITGVMPDDPIDLHNILDLLYEAFAFLIHDFGLDIIIRCAADSDAAKFAPKGGKAYEVQN